VICDTVISRATKTIRIAVENIVLLSEKKQLLRVYFSSRSAAKAVEEYFAIQ
jgi:hypothetical protein